MSVRGFVLWLASGCLAIGCGDSGGRADAGTSTCTPPDCPYGELAPWQEPIADYIAACAPSLHLTKLNRAIHDLLVFDDRLYLAYGDATLNSGDIFPTQVRYWASPDDTAATAEDLVTNEQEIEHYRRFGTTLYFPGANTCCNEEGWFGSSFVKPSGQPWQRYHTVTGGVHVHDEAEFNGALYDCGSGAPDYPSWQEGKVHSLLWRSTDQGQTWDIVGDTANSEVGDRRWTRMIPFPDKLYMFGYRSNMTRIVELTGASWDGTTYAPADNPLPDVYVNNTEMFTATQAIIQGVYAGHPLHFVTLSMTPTGTPEEIPALVGRTVLDVMVIEPGRAVLAVTDGDTYPLPRPAEVQILYTADLAEFRPIASVTPDAWPTAVAYWRGGLYLGLEDGQVLRSLPVM